MNNMLLCTNICFWNISGINNLYNLDKESIQKLLEAEIICFCETWCQSRMNAYPEFLKNYTSNITYSFAIRDKQRGRASGGIMLLFKDNVFTNIEIIDNTDLWIIAKVTLKNSLFIIGCFYISPNLDNNSCLNLISEITETIVTTYNDTKIILIGDFNSKIGNLNQIETDNIFDNPNIYEKRSALIDKVNERGRKLVNLLECSGLYVLNGRTRGDVPSKPTFSNHMGQSTIDLAWCNLRFAEHISMFEVIHTLSNTGHSIVHLKFYNDKLNFDNIANNVINKKNKIKYSIKFKFNHLNSDFYKALIADHEGIYFNSDSSEDLYKNLLFSIKECASKSDMLKVQSHKLQTHDVKSSIESKIWFNAECKLYKNQATRELKNYKKKPCRENLELFLQAKKQYNNKKDHHKKNYEASIRNSLANTKDNIEFWQTINKLTFKKSGYQNITTQEWEQFYCSLNVNKIYAKNNIYFDCLHPYFDCSISLEELEASILNFKSNKSAGCDLINYDFYKNLPENWTHYILNLFNNILSKETTPSEWSKIHMCMLFKKGDPNLLENYRGIALLNNLCKIFTQILYNRLKTWLEANNLLVENQSGFRSGRGTIDNIFCFASLVHLKLRLQKSKLFTALIDFKRAFDTINHAKLWDKLYQIGISSKFIRILQNLYNNANIFIKDNLSLDETVPISIHEGVLQGEILSPILFAIYINDLEDFFRKNDQKGVNIDGHTDILMLAYADDLVVLSDSPVSLQRKLNLLALYCDSNELTVNTSKTKILPFYRGRKPSMPAFKYKDSIVEVVKNFCYLGINFSSSGKFYENTSHAQKKAALATSKVNYILAKGKSQTWKEKNVLLQSIIKSTLLYGSEIWGLRYINNLEKCQIKFLKSILQCPRTTPDYMLRIETGTYHTVSELIKRTLNWYFKVNNMDPTRYPKIILDRLIHLDGVSINKVEFNWYSQIRDLFSQYNLSEHWNANFTKSKINDIVTAFKTTSMNMDMELLKNSKYNNHYKLIKKEFLTENYLLTNMSIAKVRVIANLRLQNKRIFSVIYNKVKYHWETNLKCTICNSNTEENAEHFFFHCPIYKPYREKFIAQYLPTNCDNSEIGVLLENLNVKKINDIFYYTTRSLTLRSFCIDE